jgi:hypothetical protein
VWREGVKMNVSRVFGFSEVSQFEWELIVDKHRVRRNLEEVEGFMFEDEDVIQGVIGLVDDAD